MINKEFYELLEYKICDALANSENEQIRHFWCDGIIPGFENEYMKKYVNENRKIVMTAFCGATGQDRFDLIINFGRKALSRYARGLDISECIPESPGSDWIEINIPKLEIRILLD